MKSWERLSRKIHTVPLEVNGDLSSRSLSERHEDCRINLYARCVASSCNVRETRFVIFLLDDSLLPFFRRANTRTLYKVSIIG